MTCENPIPYEGGGGELEDAYILHDFQSLIRRLEKQFDISFQDKENNDLFIQLCKPVVANIRGD